MKGGIRIGTIFGIPLFIDPSWFLIVAFMTVGYRADYVRVSSDLSWLFGLLTALLLFGSVLMHELGHSLTAKAQGIEVNSITLFLFGGVASIDQESKNPGAAFRVAIAGPLVSLALGVILTVLAMLLGGQAIFEVLSTINQPAIDRLVAEIGVGRSLIGAMAWNLAQINIVLGIFNLMPGLPLDGGQVVKAIVWKITGDRFTGIRAAARSGQVLGFLLMALGFMSLRYGIFVALLPILLGLFILSSAGGYLRFIKLQQALMDITAESTMTRDFRIVDADMTLRKFADEFLLMQDKETQPLYVATSDGRDRGVVVPEDLRRIENIEWNDQKLQSITKPLKSLDAVELKTKIPEVIKLLESKELKYAIVFSQVGSIAGVIDRGDVIRALARRLGWPIPETYIQQIKTEGKFPADFRLMEIIEQLTDEPKIVPKAS